MNSINEQIANFISDNEGSDVVRQLRQANDNGDREAFVQLLEHIKGAIAAEYEIKRNKARIQSHINSIKDLSREIRIGKNSVKNEKGFHKIKREKARNTL
jgi:hypothetical protein